MQKPLISIVLWIISIYLLYILLITKVSMFFSIKFYVLILSVLFLRKYIFCYIILTSVHLNVCESMYIYMHIHINEIIHICKFIYCLNSCIWWLKTSFIIRRCYQTRLIWICDFTSDLLYHFQLSWSISITL